MRLLIELGGVRVEVELLEHRAARGLWEALPLSSVARTWGEEVYFELPLDLPEEGEFVREEVEVGDVGWWPPGRALCLFFGATPISPPGRVRPASAVVLMGRVMGDPAVLRSVREGDPVRVWRR